jgi:hypothetical protein
MDLQLAESYFKESLRISIKNCGPNHQHAMQVALNLSIILLTLEQIGNFDPSEEL